MKTLILSALLGLAACTSSTGPGNSAPSGYLGMWYQRDGSSIYWGNRLVTFRDTLNFTSDTTCIVTFQSLMPGYKVKTFTENTRVVAGRFRRGDTVALLYIYASYPSSPYSYSREEYFSHDSLWWPYSGARFTR